MRERAHACFVLQHHPERKTVRMQAHAHKLDVVDDEVEVWRGEIGCLV